MSENTDNIIGSKEPFSENYILVMLARHYLSLGKDLTGKLLTLVESLGLKDSQEKAVKDSVREIITNVLGRDAREMDFTVKEIRKRGVLKENPEMESNLLSFSLEDYRHWDTIR